MPDCRRDANGKPDLLHGLDKDGKAALRKNPAVKLAMLEIQTERAAKKAAEADGDGLSLM